MTKLRLLEKENEVLSIDFRQYLVLTNQRISKYGRWLIYKDEYNNGSGKIENFIKFVGDSGCPFRYHMTDKHIIRYFFERTRCGSSNFELDRYDVVSPFTANDYKRLYDFLKENNFILNKKKRMLIDADVYKFSKTSGQDMLSGNIA